MVSSSKIAGHTDQDTKKSRRGEKRAERSDPGATTSPRSVIQAVPNELQQALLNVFRRSFPNRFGGDLTGLIQTVKGHLFNRDFDKAFGAEDLLEAYAVRWSPSRALAYLDLFSSLPQIRALLNFPAPSEVVQEELPTLIVSQPHQDLRFAAENFQDSRPAPFLHSDDAAIGSLHITCLGGGAGAEIAALAGLLYMTSCSGYHPTPANLEAVSQAEVVKSNPSSRNPAPAGLSIRVIDIADWSKVIRCLNMGIESSLNLSMTARSAEQGLQKLVPEPERFGVSFIQEDLLRMPAEGLAPFLRSSQLVTIMFTLNELYTTSMAKTTGLLLTLTYLVSPATLLLVVDSPGSYSTVDIGESSSAERSAQKKYPMQWLLDHTLLDAASVGSGKDTTQKRQWEKLDMAESKWFRLPKGLRYPLELEDMRYQYHLFRRLQGQ